MPTINVNNINLYDEVHGQGEPLLLIHGMMLDCTAWEPQLSAFSQQYQVIMFDSRGVGHSFFMEIPEEFNQAVLGFLKQAAA
jgi:3-oxoadipate enol-lactonase